MYKVLIVEDDPMVGEINKSYLSTIPEFDCIGVEQNVDDALQFLERQSVDLILLDIYMPNKDGLDLLTRIRQCKKGIDVIIISAASDMKTIKAALRLGAVDYLIKPFKYDRLHSALMYYLEKQKLTDDKEKVSQSELDQFIRNPQQSQALRRELPKGLTLPTLEHIISILKGKEGSSFTTDDIAHLTAISRVSIRKYLKFLTSINVLTYELNYKQIGRPEYVYHLNQNYKEAIGIYLKKPM